MKIEPGKFYRCRDGSKARIYAVDGGGLYPIQGAVYWREVWTPEEWSKSGDALEADGSDIVSEWQDPKPRLRAFMDNLGQVRFIVTDCDNSTERWTRVPWLDQPEEK